MTEYRIVTNDDKFKVQYLKANLTGPIKWLDCVKRVNHMLGGIELKDLYFHDLCCAQEYIKKQKDTDEYNSKEWRVVDEENESIPSLPDPPEPHTF